MYKSVTNIEFLFKLQQWRRDQNIHTEPWVYIGVSKYEYDIRFRELHDVIFPRDDEPIVVNKMQQLKSRLKRMFKLK